MNWWRVFFFFLIYFLIKIQLFQTEWCRNDRLAHVSPSIVPRGNESFLSSREVWRDDRDEEETLFRPIRPLSITGCSEENLAAESFNFLQAAPHECEWAPRRWAAVGRTTPAGASSRNANLHFSFHHSNQWFVFPPPPCGLCCVMISGSRKAFPAWRSSSSSIPASCCSSHQAITVTPPDRSRSSAATVCP